LQPDGKIVVLGDQDDPGTGQFFMKLVRFNSDGSLDTTFGNAGTAVSYIVGYGAAVAVQVDGKIVAVGTDYVTQGIFTTQYPVVLRFNPDGYLDQTFGSGGEVFVNYVGSTREATSVAIQSDGKILIGGDYSSGNGSPFSFMVLRFNPDGSRDYG